jgi:hypothetical protein
MTEQPREMTRGERWKQELTHAKEWLKPWHEEGKEILKRLKSVRPKNSAERRVNLFTSECLTKRAILYGKTPTVDVSRRWKDAEDDLARVGAEMVSRLLNDDIASGSDGYQRALGYSLEDRLYVGMGQGRVRYEAKTERQHGVDTDSYKGTADGATATSTLASRVSSRSGTGAVVPVDVGPLEANGPGMQASPPNDAAPPESITYECVKVDYAFWQDFLWSPCKYWEVNRWVAFGNDMGRKALATRFNKATNPNVLVDGATLPLDTTTPPEGRKKDEPEPPWGRARVWEIWDKDEHEVLWVTESGTVLEVRKDPYGLKNFFPCPRPLFSLVTTEELIPRPDFVLAEDLYNDLDTLSTRMHLLRTALRVVGFYDASSKDELADLMNDTSENRMIPVQNWAALSEKGGISGAVQFFPVQEVAAALLALSQEYLALEARLYQVTGWSDILRGQGAATAVTATEQRIKANFGSARVQAIQDDFARFASELQALKYELICNLYEPSEIVRQSNMLRTPDAAIALQAAEFLTQDSEAFRVKVQPETLALSDFSALKEERMEVVAAVGQYIGAATPLLELVPSAGPALLEILKWLVAALRGAGEIEGILDKAIEMANQAVQQPQQAQQPDMSKAMAEQAKTQGALAKVEAESQARLKEISAEVQAAEMTEANQMRFNVQEHAQKQMISTALRPQQPSNVVKPKGSP